MWQHLYKKEKTIEDQKINDLITEFFKIGTEKTAINTQINKIKQTIINYMETEKLGRVFGEAGYLSKSIKKNFDYDLIRLESELKANKLWDQVLSFDEKKLDLLLETLPSQLKKRIADSKIFTGDTISLKSTKTKKKF
ncbi:hypothetical protein HY061_01120 [Candidatus Azambacteria bacterium]|nr:hypothetical protein [Candidatus Azambacteria bacterium]